MDKPGLVQLPDKLFCKVYDVTMVRPQVYWDTEEWSYWLEARGQPYSQGVGRVGGVKWILHKLLSTRSKYWQLSLEPAADDWYKGFWDNVLQSSARHCKQVIFSLITKRKNVTLKGRF